MKDYNAIWQANPLQLEAVPVSDLIVIPTLSGRSEFKRDPAEIKALTASIQARGQLEPAIVGLNTDESLGEIGAPVLYMGFGRYEACKAAAMHLLCMYSPKPVDTVLLDSMHENTKREELSPIQIAINIKRLMAGGMKAKEVAASLQWSPGTVFIYNRFNEESEDGTPLFSKYAKDAIHLRKIPKRDAYKLTELKTPDRIDKAVEKALAAGESVKGDRKKASAVGKALRDEVRTEGKTKRTKAGKKKGGSVKRTPKEVYDQLVEWDVEGVPDLVRATAKKFRQYWDGEIDEKALNALMKVGERLAA